MLREIANTYCCAKIESHLNPNKNSQIMYTKCTVMELLQLRVLKTGFIKRLQIRTSMLVVRVTYFITDSTKLNFDFNYIFVKLTHLNILND